MPLVLGIGGIPAEEPEPKLNDGNGRNEHSSNCGASDHHLGTIHYFKDDFFGTSHYDIHHCRYVRHGLGGRKVSGCSEQKRSHPCSSHCRCARWRQHQAHRLSYQRNTCSHGEE